MPRGAAPGERRGGRAKGTLNHATKSLKEMAQKYTESALLCLVEIYQDKSAPPAARRAAASDLLDRGHGKAVATQISVEANETQRKTLADFYSDQKTND